jgi:PAS domain S-box-containing protein
MSTSPLTQARDAGVPHVDDVITTQMLEQRPARPPGYAAESQALLSLMTELAESPFTVLQRLCDITLELLGAQSSGISLEENNGEEEIFRWHATAGEYRRYLGGTMPRHFSPCGTVLDRGTSLLMDEPDRFYPYMASLHEPVREVLLVPFGRGNELIGTVWAVAHDDAKKFDAEDHRLLSSLARFASMAVKSLSDLRTLSETTCRLSVMHGRLDAALQAGAIATWTWDFAADRLLADRNLLPIVGLPAKLGDGMSTAEFMAVIHADDRAAVSEAMRRSVATGERYEASYRVVDGDGTVRWIVARGKPTRNADGVIVDLSGVVSDITARKLDEIRNQAVNRRQTEFLATLAHELRNPLAPIVNGLAILRRREAGDEPNPVFAMMDRQVSHMRHLIDDLLDVSRIASDKIALRCARIDFATVIEGGVEMARPMTAAANQRIHVEAPAPVFVEGDALRLTQVCGNLLSNASKFSPNGSEIRVTLQREGDTACMRVTDDGIGIPADQLGTIFEMFAQGDQSEARVHGGLGIGLALVKKLVALHGGSVHAESAGAGCGSTFIVNIPVAVGRDETRG